MTQLSQSSFMLQVNKGIRDAAKKLADQGMEVIIKENASVDESEQMQAIRNWRRQVLTDWLSCLWTVTM
ncbi:MAG: hypothetical protein ACLRMZ_22795 [Blautia marasmi]